MSSQTTRIELDHVEDCKIVSEELETLVTSKLVAEELGTFAILIR